MTAPVFSTIFDPENAFWRAMSLLTDVLVLSLLWLFCSLPVLTLGPATAGLYDAVVKYVRPRRHGAWLQFFRVFRRELAGGAAASALWAAALAALLAGLQFFWQAQLARLSGAPLVLAAYFVCLLIPVGGLCWTFPALSRFTLSPLAAMVRGVQLAVAYLPFTLLIVLSGALSAALSLLFYVPMLILPCLTAMLWSVMMERAFRRFTPGADPS